LPNDLANLYIDNIGKKIQNLKIKINDDFYIDINLCHFAILSNNFKLLKTMIKKEIDLFKNFQKNGKQSTVEDLIDLLTDKEIKHEIFLKRK